MPKNWLKQHKAAPALDFPYFQSVSILVVQDRKAPGMDHSGCFLLLFEWYKFGLSNTFLTHALRNWGQLLQDGQIFRQSGRHPLVRRRR